MWALFGGGDDKSTQFIMDRTVDIDAKDKDGFTALHLAIEGENITTLKTLLEHGANPNIKCATGETPLEYALELGQDDHVDQLLQHGADPNISWPHGETPLEYATQCDLPWNIISQLLEHGAEARY